MSSTEWFNKLKKIVNDSNQGQNNPTVNSLLYMLNNMVDEYGQYKELGSIKELKKYKEIALKKNGGDCKPQRSEDI